jgi:hypothetical protein
MSEMSQASAPAGGDPLDLTPDMPGAEGDALPGAGVDTTEDSEESDGVSGGAMDIVSDPSPEGGATLDPPGVGADAPDPASGVDPLQGTEASGVQVPGEAGGDLESGADPMPDMSGTS